MEPATGVKAAQIIGIWRAIWRVRCRSLSLCVVETIPGKNVMGIEIPIRSTRNRAPRPRCCRLKVYNETLSPLTVALGKDIAGNPVVADLDKMPHLLIAGTTASGKSVCINTPILTWCTSPRRSMCA